MKIKTVRPMLTAAISIAAALLFLRANTFAQTVGAGTLEDIRVHAPSLEHNLLGDSADKRVLVYLPQGYASSPARHYPVVYILHGYSLEPGLLEDWGTVVKGWMDKLTASKAIREMIVVIPDGQDAYIGGFYTNSVTTGNYDDYIAKDLVAYVDSHYRTIAQAASRGVGGHSMGGYGAIWMGMKHPEVFSVVYGLSPCCIGFEADLTESNPAWHEAIHLKTREDVNGQIQKKNFYVSAMIALSAAFSPDPRKPPLYAALPFREQGNQVVPNEPAYSEWKPHFPLNQIDKYRENLLKLKGIMFDYGLRDEFAHIPTATREFSHRLAQAGIPHIFEVFDGTHDSLAAERVGTKMLPFFSNLLAPDNTASAVSSTN